MGKKKTPNDSNTIVVNRKASHDYFIEQTLETGLALQGWEVKSLRAGRGQIAESHVVIRQGEMWLIGSTFTPLPTTSTHITADPTRLRKLLAHRGELDKWIGLVEQRGYTIVPLKMYWKAGKAKMLIGLAKGKKLYDKRASEKDKDWQRQKARILSQNQ